VMSIGYYLFPIPIELLPNLIKEVPILTFPESLLLRPYLEVVFQCII